MSTDDETLAGPTPTEPSGVGRSPFGTPHPPENPLPDRPPVKQWTLQEVLASAKRHRTVAHICMRADLQAEYDELMREIAALVDTQGRLTPAAEETLGDTAAAVVQEKDARAQLVRREMNTAMWRVEFEGMPEDKWRPFYERHYPKKARTDGETDLTDFNNRLIAEVAVNPTLTIEDVIELRGVLTAPQITELANKAWLACASGGVDIPKSPAFLRNLQLG